MAVVDERAAGVEAAAGPHLNDLIEARISRRTVIAGGMAAVAGFMAGGVGASAAAAHGRGRGHARLLGFDAIPLGFGDDVVVPRGYSARPLHSLGHADPRRLPGVPAGRQHRCRAGAADRHAPRRHALLPARQGLARQPPGPARAQPRVHRRALPAYRHDDDAAVAEWTLEMVRKSQNAHGVAVVEIAKGHKGWEVVRSKLNRRITANTTMAVSGPAAGHRLLRTSADPSGRRPLGTFNNCAHGHTPWATYLTCEENFHGYFRLEPGSYEDGAEGSDPGTAAVLAQQRADALERPGRDREVGERPALLALDDARLEQLLEVVADRRLLERKQVFEVADAHGLAPGLEQAVEDLDAVAVGERLEHALELAGLVLGQARLGERGAALDEGESAHVLHHIEES
jgi:hypothetical protein